MTPLQMNKQHTDVVFFEHVIRARVAQVQVGINRVDRLELTLPDATRMFDINQVPAQTLSRLGIVYIPTTQTS